VTTKTKGPTSTPSFDATLTLPPGYFKTRTILVEIMDKLRFGADVPIAHTLIDLKKSAFQAGKKGTLFEWYGLEHAASETNGGEISLSFAFEALPEPVSNETVVILKPWYLTAEGLYIGVKDTWEWLEEVREGGGAKDGRLEQSDSRIQPITIISPTPITGNPFRARFAPCPRPNPFCDSLRSSH